MASLNNKLEIKEKFLGSFLGAVIGDAIGWPQEINSKNTEMNSTSKHPLNSWTRRSGGMYYSHLEKLLPGEYSDDSQLLIATARSLKYKENWSKHFGKVELPSWIVYERGGGGATKRAAKSLSEGIPPWKINKDVKNVQRYFEAGGNGVVMRIMPHVFYSQIYNKDMYHQIMINGIYTHGHPRALVGALLYAKAIKYLINLETTLEYGGLVNYLISTVSEWGEFPKFSNYSEWLASAEIVLNGDYIKLWNQAVQESIEGLEIIKDGLNQGVLDDQDAILNRLGCFNPKVLGAGTVGSLVAIFLASKYASNPNIGLLEAAYLRKADTDTIASLVGGLLGALHGCEWIKLEWNVVQDREYIQHLVDDLMNLEPMKQEPSDFRLWSYQDNEIFKKKLKQLEVNSTIYLGPFELTLIEKNNLKPLVKNLKVLSSKLRSEKGQSVYITTYEKIPYETKKVDDKNQRIQKVVNKNIYEDLIAFQSHLLNHLPTRFTAKKLIKLLNLILESTISKDEISDKEIINIRESISDKYLTEKDIRKINDLLINFKKYNN
jgi:ADP-ribosylglycohydrolase